MEDATRVSGSIIIWKALAVTNGSRDVRLMVNFSTTRRMAMVSTTGLMVAAIWATGRMVSSMASACTWNKIRMKAKQFTVFGNKVRKPKYLTKMSYRK